MKIIAPADGKTIDAPVCQSFGRTPIFLIFDTENESCSFLDNEASNCQGGAGIKAAQIIADMNADVVITYRCGQNAADVLKAAGIKLYKAHDGSLKDNIVKLKYGELLPLNEIHPGLHNRVGGEQ